MVHEEQLEVLNENVMSLALGIVHDELKTEFKEIERKTRHNKYARITYKPGTRPQYANLPVTQGDEWATEIICNTCGMRFSVIGNAFFCPCCGKDLTTNAIRDSLQSFRRRINGLDKLLKLFERTFSVEEAERQVVALREDTLNSLVGTFDSFAKNRYIELGGEPPKGNVFQRIKDGSNLYYDLTGKSYRDFISDDEFDEMRVLVNRRHLLTHNNGFADERYLRNSCDVFYKLGQRIVVKESDLNKLLEAIEKIVIGLQELQLD